MIYVEVNSTSVYTEKLHIENVITSSPDFAYFTMVNPAFTPSAGHSVLIYRNSTSNILFGGQITSVKQQQIAPNQNVADIDYSYDIMAVDYQILLNERLVANTYEDKTCYEIVSDLVDTFTESAHGITYNNVDTGPTIEDIRWNYIKAQDCIKELADLVNFEWYVDSDKDIHFFQKETISAPFAINDNALKEYIFDFSITPDYTQVRNRVYVRGGYYLSSSYTESFLADGAQRIFPLGFAPHAPTVLTVGGVAKTFALDHLNPDDGTYDYYWSYTEQYLRCGDGTPTATPGNGVTVAFTYQYEIPIIVRADNETSQDAIAAIRGGDGVIEHIIRDDSISSREIAHDIALADGNLFGNVSINGSFTTYEHDFQAGQYIQLDLTGYESYDGNYQIKRVTIKSLGNNVLIYNVEFGTTLYELRDLLNHFLKAEKRYRVRVEDTVDILKIDEEIITVTDIVSYIKKDTHPTKWGTRKWGRFTWA